MKIDKVYFFLAAVSIVSTYFWVSSCQHDPNLSGNFPEICFEKEVLPIFQNNCSMAGCHDGLGESGSSYNNYIDISHGVVAGNPRASRLYQAIIAKSGEGRMPPGNPLSLQNRTIIRLWIEQGARLTVCPDSSSQPPVIPPYNNPRACFSRDILPVLVSSCAMTGCHDAANHEQDYTFVSYSSTIIAVSPGNPGNSVLYQAITTISGEHRMPPLPYDRLSTAVIDSIAAWIGYGALDEYCGEVCDTINPVTFSGVIWPTIQTYCTGCHSGGSPSGAVSLNGYSDVQTIASSGMLMNALKGNTVAKMPPSGSFSTCKIRQFQLWVDNGYLNN
jgi:hypothetical protein